MAACRTPIISAVGHETDTTIADLVADVRAPTPSAAAEIAVRDVADVLLAARRQTQRAEAAARRRLREITLRLEALRRSRVMASPLDRLRQESQRADELAQRCLRAAQVALARLGERTHALGLRIEALSPARVLDRGYALVYDVQGRLVRTAGECAAGDSVEVQFGRGRARCRVERIWPAAGPLSGTGGPARPGGNA
jgi:exodeoxyribonuclease VII large subunit